MFKIFWAWDKEDLNNEVCLEVEESEQDYFDEWQVALDIVEKADEIIIIAPIAWVDLDDIDLHVKDNILTISGERKKPIEIYSSGFMLRVDECFWGKFTRNIIMPENVDLDMIKAILEKNILVIRIPKLRFNNQSIKIDKIDD